MKLEDRLTWAYPDLKCRYSKYKKNFEAEVCGAIAKKLDRCVRGDFGQKKFVFFLGRKYYHWEVMTFVV